MAPAGLCFSYTRAAKPRVQGSTPGAVFPLILSPCIGPARRPGNWTPTCSDSPRRNSTVANRALAFATVLYPSFMFLVVAGGVAYFVISIYTGYLKMLGKLAE